MLTRAIVFVLRWKICAMRAAPGTHTEVSSLDGRSASLPAGLPASNWCGKRRLRPLKGDATQRTCLYESVIPLGIYRYF